MWRFWYNFSIRSNMLSDLWNIGFILWMLFLSKSLFFFFFLKRKMSLCLFRVNVVPMAHIVVNLKQFVIVNMVAWINKHWLTSQEQHQWMNECLLKMFFEIDLNWLMNFSLEILKEKKNDQWNERKRKTNCWFSCWRLFQWRSKLFWLIVDGFFQLDKLNFTNEDKSKKISKNYFWYWWKRLNNCSS